MERLDGIKVGTKVLLNKTSNVVVEVVGFSGELIKVKGNTEGQELVAISEVYKVLTDLEARVDSVGYQLVTLLMFLDEVRLSGSINMYGASGYIREWFPELDRNLSKEVVKYWMDNFKM